MNDQHATADASDPTAVLDTTEAGGKAIRGSALRLVGYGASVALSVLGAALMTRHLGPVDFGRYAVVQSVIAIVAGLAESGMVNVGIREYAVREGAERERMVRDLQGIRISFNLAALGIGVAFGAIAGYPSPMVAGIALTGVGLLFQTVQSTWSIPLNTALRLGWVTALDLLRQTVQVAVIVALVAAGASLLPFFVIPIPVGIALAAVTYVLVRGTVPLWGAFSWERWKPLLKMIAPYATAVAVSSIYVYLAAVVMSLVASDVEVGLFSAAFRVFIVVGGIPLLLVGSAFPILARAARDDATRLTYATQRLFETSALVGGWFALMVLVGAPVIIDVIAGGGAFDGAVSVLRIQSAAVLASFIGVTGSYVLVSRNRTGVLVWANVVALTLAGVTTLVLAPSMGADGGAVANVAGETAVAIAYTAALVTGPGRLRLNARAVPPLVLALGAGAALLLTGLPSLVLCVLATVVYWGVMLAGRAVPDELLDVVLRR